MPPHPIAAPHCSGIGLLAGMTNLLTVLVRLCLAIQKPFPRCIMSLKLHKYGLRCSVSLNILVTYPFYVWSSGIILQRRNDLLICSVDYLIFFTRFLKTNLVIWKVLSYSSKVQVNIHSLLNWSVSKRNLQLGMFLCLFIGSSILVVRFLEKFNVAKEHFLPLLRTWWPTHICNLTIKKKKKKILARFWFC